MTWASRATGVVPLLILDQGNGRMRIYENLGCRRRR